MDATTRPMSEPGGELAGFHPAVREWFQSRFPLGPWLPQEHGWPAIAAGHDQATAAILRPFFYLPYEHSEDMGDQDEAVRLCAALKEAEGDADTLKWAELHRDIIVRFGRFPHRNAALGRRTTPSEQAFLDEGGFAG